MRCPERDDGVVGCHDRERGLQRQPNAWQTILIGEQRGQRRRPEDLGLGGVVGAYPRDLEARDVGEVCQCPGGAEQRDEAGEVIAVLREDRRAWRLRDDEAARHGVEEPPAHELAGDREGVRQRGDQRHHDVVAVDRETRRRICAVPGDEPRRQRVLGIQQRGSELSQNGGAAPHAATSDHRLASVRTDRALEASSTSTSSGGIA